jgi:hypothetical protein
MESYRMVEVTVYPVYEVKKKRRIKTTEGRPPKKKLIKRTIGDHHMYGAIPTITITYSGMTEFTLSTDVNKSVNMEGV